MCTRINMLNVRAQKRNHICARGDFCLPPLKKSIRGLRRAKVRFRGDQTNIPLRRAKVQRDQPNIPLRRAKVRGEGQPNIPVRRAKVQGVNQIFPKRAKAHGQPHILFLSFTRTFNIFIHVNLSYFDTRTYIILTHAPPSYFCARIRHIYTCALIIFL